MCNSYTIMHDCQGHIKLLWSRHPASNQPLTTRRRQRPRFPRRKRAGRRKPKNAPNAHRKTFFPATKTGLGGVPATLKPFLRDHDRPANRGKALHSSPSPRTLVLEKLFSKYFHHNLWVGKCFVLGPMGLIRMKPPQNPCQFSSMSV